MKKKYIGIHLLAEFWGSPSINDSKKIGKLLVSAAKEAGNIPLRAAFHKFSPRGITGVLLLAESHIAFHSWPQFDYLAIDIFTCGKKTFPYKAIAYLEKKLAPKKVEIREIKRGIIIK